MYVPSKKRDWLLPRTAPTWPKDIPITVMVESDDYLDYDATLSEIFPDNPPDLYVLPERGRGYGYVLQHILEHAMTNGHEHIVIADDDMILQNTSHLLDYLRRNPGCTQIGSWIQVYAKFGLERPEDEEAVPSWTSFGNAVFGLNVKHTLECGGYDIRLPFFTDVDLVLRTAAMTRLVPRMVSTISEAKQVGARGSTGGCSAMGKSRDQQVQETREVLLARYGDRYVGGQTKKDGVAPKLRFQYKKFYVDHGLYPLS